MNVSGANTLQANEFTVEIDGELIDSIVTCEAFTYLQGDAGGGRSSISMRKRVEDSPTTAFNRWLIETLAAPAADSRPCRTVVVTALNDGTPIRRWTFAGSKIMSIVQGGFEVDSYEFADEQVTIGYDRMSCELLG